MHSVERLSALYFEKFNSAILLPLNLSGDVEMVAFGLEPVAYESHFCRRREHSFLKAFGYVR